MEANPALWLSAVSQSRVRDTFCSYGVMELCTKGLGSSVHALKARGVSLACVRTCVVVAEERPRIALTSSFSKLFSALGLSPRAVSTSFGCRVNTAICLQVKSINAITRFNCFDKPSSINSSPYSVGSIQSGAVDGLCGSTRFTQ